MRATWTVLETLFTAIGGAVGWFLGGTDGFLLALVALTILDYVSGVIAAYTTHSLSSAVGFKGIARKVMIFALVGLANIIDIHVLGEGGVMRTATIFFYLANEGLSILENATRIGLPIPDKLADALAAISTTGPRGKHTLDADAAATSTGPAEPTPDSEVPGPQHHNISATPPDRKDETP
jgi:toxin secretion/phage lysis holin